MTGRRIHNGQVYVWTRRGWRLVRDGYIRTRKGWRRMRRRPGRRPQPAAAPPTEQFPPITATTGAPARLSPEPAHGQWVGKYEALRVRDEEGVTSRVALPAPAVGRR